MTPAEFKKEHLRLIKVLKSGTKKQQKEEAARQLAELLLFMKKQSHKK